MAGVALFTIGILHAPDGDPRVQGFFDRTGATFAAAEASPGFLGRCLYDETAEADTWGVATQPAIFDRDEFADRVAQTLSVWRDVQSAFGFAYRGVHAEAMSKRREWFVRPEWPSYVAWWIDDAATPSWQEAYQQYEKLRCQGVSPLAFDFKHPFGPDGQPITIDRTAVERITKRTVEE